jgi:predicted O-methyltransferase YrrM
VLEIGCHIGSGAVVIGSALKTNDYGKLFTLEPQGHYANLAERFIRQANLAQWVEVVRHFSHQDECKAKLKREGPFDVIFIDGSHEYDDAFHDIALSYDLLRSNGVAVLHDVGRHSPAMDTSQQGGVRKALHDFTKDTPGASTIYFEHPLWPNPCGAALLCKQDLEPAV